MEEIEYIADIDRYDKQQYNRLGRSGLKLPMISYGLWHNFEDNSSISKSMELLSTAFNNGITYFDLANNYGVPAGSAESRFGTLYKKSFKHYRDEMIISTKAGHYMTPGPYGDWGSRKSLISSLDQSLNRTSLDYFDIFYSHRYDPETPLEETMGALDYAVRSGKALYAGISKYPVEAAKESIDIMRRLGTPLLVHQVRYNMLTRDIEKDLFKLHNEEGLGCVSFSPLAQGLLSERYLEGIPDDSRAAKNGFLKRDSVEANIFKIKKLNEFANRRGQSLSQLAISWQLYDKRIDSVIIGASSSKQIIENIKATEMLHFTNEEIEEINNLLNYRN